MGVHHPKSTALKLIRKDTNNALFEKLTDEMRQKLKLRDPTKEYSPFELARKQLLKEISAQKHKLNAQNEKLKAQKRASSSPKTTTPGAITPGENPVTSHT